MSLRHIYFPLKDASLRDDVGVLGTLLGEIIEEQAGERVLTQVESARRAAIRRREHDAEAAEELADILKSIEDVSSFVRAYSIFFQIVNLAERVHRIRRRRDYLRSSELPQPGGIEEAVRVLASEGVGVQELQNLLDRLLIEPVFTAHPTEATRRSILRKHLRIARMLVERIDPSLSPPEARRLLHRIRGEVTALWQTEEHPESGRTVSDESEHVLFYLTEIIYRIVPPFYEALEEAARRTYGAGADALRVPTCMRFGSWVGGDMDGNPNVGADTIRETIERHRSTICAMYRRELEGLYEQLTQSGPHGSVSDDVFGRIADYEKTFPDLAARFPSRHANMPYRRLIRLIQARVEATARGDASGYRAVDGFLEDLGVIAASLKAHRGEHAGLFLVQRLITRARTFEFHLATLDLRQDSQVHRSAVGSILGDTGWSDREARNRADVLLTRMAGPPPNIPDDEEVARVISVFGAVSRARAEVGGRAVGLYIISMTQDVDDVLSVLALAHWSGLSESGVTPLDVAPLFETVGDLAAAPDVLESLFSEPVYRSHLETRDNRQVVMIGYSDSGKDGGIAAARWGLHQAQARIKAVGERHGIEITLFHGRGGTVSRGGGRIDRAVEAAPSAYSDGHLRLTEQGEVINKRYGVRDIAERSAEQMFAPMILAMAGSLKDGDRPERSDIGETLSTESRAAYRSLVYDDPEFYPYFRSATPIDVIERMQIGSRPSSRRAQRGIQDLRAIPWVFAWTQSRHQLTGWYGVGSGLSAAVERHGREAVASAVAEWPYLRSFVTDVESDLAAADLTIARAYADLTGRADHPVYARIAEEYDLAVRMILDLKGTSELLEEEDVLRRGIDLRNPYIDPLSLLQINLLESWRADDRPEDERLRLLVSTVKGISQGIQNTG